MLLIVAPLALLKTRGTGLLFWLWSAAGLLLVALIAESIAHILKGRRTPPGSVATLNLSEGREGAEKAEPQVQLRRARAVALSGFAVGFLLVGALCLVAAVWWFPEFRIAGLIGASLNLLVGGLLIVLALRSRDDSRRA
jgi:hypothetical protein